jgi:uncharacterized RDD family membrane protein YckC
MNGAPPAGFWIRVVAALVDFAIFALVHRSFAYLAARLAGSGTGDSPALASLVWLFTILFTAAYTTVLHATFGHTVGKMLTRVRVVSLDGERVTVGAAFLRYIGYFASLATLTLGFVMAGLRRDKRALHDLIAGTRAERVRYPRVATVAEVDVDAVASGR